MGHIVGIFGMSGDGKTTSHIIDKNGNYDPKNYGGMDPDSHIIFNLDRKPLTLPPGLWCRERKNYILTPEPATFQDIKKVIEAVSKRPDIRSITFDTLNIYLAYKEFNDRKKLVYDQWRDIANDIIELNMLCNDKLRDDQIAYIMGHVELVTDADGQEKKMLSVIGKKSKRQMPEGFYTTCLFTRMESDGEGNNRHYFQTKAAKSTAKSPMGMFDSFEIPNSLKLVDDHVRAFYDIK